MEAPPCHTSVSTSLKLQSWWHWCLPALCLGLAIRLALLWEWPDALYWPDSKDALFTAKRWLENYSLSLHYKKAWLPPVAYAFASYLPGGLLSWAAWLQHALGLFSILAVGGLCRTWFRHWRFWIIPVTVLIAINPAILVWEHSLMQEPWFMPAVLFCAWQLGYFIHEPSQKRFRWLAIAAFLCASTRPEGKLFLAILPLALLWLWKFQRPLLKYAAICTAICTLLTVVTSQKGQSGLLLMTSVVPFTPDALPSHPELGPPLAKIRDDLAAADSYKKRIPSARTRKAVNDAIKRYLKDVKGQSPNDHDINRFSKKLATQILLQQPDRIPAWLWFKFRRVAYELPSTSWTSRYLIDDQVEGLSRDDAMITVMGKRLFGTPAPRPEDTDDWIRANYRPADATHWMQRFITGWEKHLSGFRPTPQPAEDADDLETVPYLKWIAMLSMVAMLVGWSRSHQIQWIMVPVLLGLLCAILLSANIKPRFLFFIEPFWYIYPWFLFDLAAQGIIRLLPDRTR